MYLRTSSEITKWGEVLENCSTLPVKHKSIHFIKISIDIYMKPTQTFSVTFIKNSAKQHKLEIKIYLLLFIEIDKPRLKL